MPQAKTEVALQFSETCPEEVALQHSLFCNAEVLFTKSCNATSEKLHCSFEKAASSGLPRLGPAEVPHALTTHTPLIKVVEVHPLN